jgi:Tol biopolymer transport system component
VSPDGKRVAVCIQESFASAPERDIWIFDVERGASIRLTFDPKDDCNPIWSPDGSRIAFFSNRKGVRDLYVKNASGAGEDELLLETGFTKNAEDWSRDGRTLLYSTATPGSRDDVWTYSFDTRQPKPLLQTQFQENWSRFSPDGKWVAYRSDATGRFEIYIQAYGGSGRRWVVSTGGGSEAHWRADGKELFYCTLQNPAQIMAVDIDEKDGAPVIGVPHALFETRLSPSGRRFLVTPDGQKFLAIVPLEKKPATSINVIVNWPALLRK